MKGRRPEGRSGIRDRLLAGVLGVLFAGLLLELGVRLVGMGFLFLQERRNRVTLNHEGAYRILCVGDSMTAGTYPRPLENILNARGAGRRFLVIDKARPATTSRDVVAALPGQLAQYRPDMVLAMMGSNDPGEVLLYGGLPASGGSALKLLRLAGFLRYAAAQRWGGRTPAARPPPGPSPGPAAPPSAQREEPFAKEVRQARGFLDQGLTKEAEQAFREILRRSPDHTLALMGLGDCYALLGEDERPRLLFEKAVRKAPPRLLYAALLRLGWHCRERGRLAQAADAFRRAMRLEPRQSWPYRELGLVHQRSGRLREAVELFEKAAAVDPRDSGLLMLAGSHRLRLGQLAEARSAFQRAAAVDPDDARAYGGLATCYGLQGEAELARRALAKANALRRSRCVALTRDNYRRVRQLASRSGARLVCIQYPRRSLAELVNLFEDPAGVLFVDNEAPFERALRAAPLTDYFIDFFAGDFGHCTEKGYRLLAQNIADVILRALPPPEAGRS